MIVFPYIVYFKLNFLITKLPCVEHLFCFFSLIVFFLQDFFSPQAYDTIQTNNFPAHDTPQSNTFPAHDTMQTKTFLAHGTIHTNTFPGHDTIQTNTFPAHDTNQNDTKQNNKIHTNNCPSRDTIQNDTIKKINRHTNTFFVLPSRVFSQLSYFVSPTKNKISSFKYLPLQVFLPFSVVCSLSE